MNRDVIYALKECVRLYNLNEKRLARKYLEWALKEMLKDDGRPG